MTKLHALQPVVSDLREGLAIMRTLRTNDGGWRRPANSDLDEIELCLYSSAKWLHEYTKKQSA